MKKDHLSKRPRSRSSICRSYDPPRCGCNPADRGRGIAPTFRVRPSVAWDNGERWSLCADRATTCGSKVPDKSPLSGGEKIPTKGPGSRQTAGQRSEREGARPGWELGRRGSSGRGRAASWPGWGWGVGRKGPRPGPLTGRGLVVRRFRASDLRKRAASGPLLRQDSATTATEGQIAARYSASMTWTFGLFQARAISEPDVTSAKGHESRAKAPDDPADPPSDPQRRCRGVSLGISGLRPGRSSRFCL